jgi:hypothetical protein
MLSVANKTIKLNVALPSVVMVNVVRLDVVAPRLKLFFRKKVKKISLMLRHQRIILDQLWPALYHFLYFVAVS